MARYIEDDNISYRYKTADIRERKRLTTENTEME
jgi:hypothetical protein